MPDLNVSRTETKYLIAPTEAAVVQQDLRRLLVPDEYSSSGPYRVKSLYFDSINQRDYIEKMNGEKNRRKIRLRIYDEDDSVILLEEKVKRDIFQQKRGVVLHKEDATLLTIGDYSALHKYDSPEALSIYLRMVLGNYYPVSLVEYDRCAYVFPAFHTRVTFDSNIRSSELDLSQFCRNNNWTFRMNDMVILEVKYDGYLPKNIAEVLGKYSFSQRAVGKYAMSRPIFLDIMYI
jgi:hypothetical protein